MKLPEIPKNLIEKIKKGNVVIFVGAGLSMIAGFPDWKNLTISILEELIEKDDKVKGYINALKDNLFEPIEILKKIEHLKSFAIEGLEHEMKKYDSLLPTKIHEKIGLISTKLITTNYDELLEKYNSDFEKVTYYNTYKLAKISDYEKYIFKIHGDINEPDKCVLFPKEYEELYSHGEKCSVFELKKIFSDKSILFIGFSLNDPYINYIKNYITTLYSGFSPEHFIVTAEKNIQWGERITPIFLEDFLHLESLVDLLIEKKSIQEDSNEIKIFKEVGENENIIRYSEHIEYDIPPNVKYWVGRKREIENISNENFRVIFITGIGGQGKSALASHYLRNFFNTDSYEFGDWRDFKEETNRFQTKIISIIKRLTGGEIDAKKLESLNNFELVDSFFHYLGTRKIIFVFDNVDSYIDLEDFIPTGGIGYLFSEALKRSHNSRLIFTCRPFIREAGVYFYQISLDGLSKNECFELFKCYNVPINDIQLETFCEKSHLLTKGHPLWLNLIAAQAIRGIETASSFIENIENRTDFKEEDFSSILSQKILSQVWESLNEKQQNLLRGIAETVKPETLNNLKQVLDSELNNNQFDKAFKTLKNLNLIEIKSSSISEDQIELHPLVKESILSKYPRIERAKFITLLVKYYDSFIYILKPKLNSSLSLTAFQNWTTKIELEINKGDFVPALIALQEVSSSILSAGFSEEYLRVAEILFDSLDWVKALEKEYSYFHSQFSTLTTTLTQFGKFDKSDFYLEKYEKLIPGKSTFYLNFCSEKCYLKWFQEEFEEAILIGEKGEFLLTNSGLSDSYSLRHNLALARRDSRIKDNISKAIHYFLNGEDLAIIVDDQNFRKDLGGTFYGNVGRCLHFMGDNENALKCYCNSLKILYTQDNEYSKFNIGYAYLWIAEMHLGYNKIQDGLHFLKCAMNSWERISPPRANRIKKKWDDVICDKETKIQIDRKADWQIEKFCKQKIAEYSTVPLP